MTAAAGEHSTPLRSFGLLALALGALAAAVMAGGESRAPLAIAAELPLPVLAARCAARGAAAEPRAVEAASAADRHMARYPFAPREGLRALALLAEARDCNALGGGAAGVGVDAALAERAERYRTRLAADYRDRVLRIRRAVARQSGVLGTTTRLPAAERERVRDDVDDLLELLAGRSDPFVGELRALQLELAGDDVAVSGEDAP